MSRARKCWRIIQQEGALGKDVMRDVDDGRPGAECAGTAQVPERWSVYASKRPSRTGYMEAALNGTLHAEEECLLTKTIVWESLWEKGGVS